MSRVEIVEVGPRDGLQNEAHTLSVEARMQFVQYLVESGLKRIEVGAFVSPQWVPQMQGSAELIHKIFAKSFGAPKGTRFSALVPNLQGMTSALQTPIREVAIFGGCSETFSQKNINCSIQESLVRFAEVLTLAHKHKIKVRGYLSVAFGCPYEGKVSEQKVIQLTKKLLALGVYEVSIGDTIGVATPKQVRSLLVKLKKHRVPFKQLALHMHDTRGTALANVLAGLDLGIRTFDSSYGGLGGCPYAKGASGNLATEDLVYMLHGMGLRTGINLDKLLQMSPSVQAQVGHALTSRMLQAGLPNS